MEYGDAPVIPWVGARRPRPLTPTRGDLVLLTSWTSTRASPPSVTSVASSPCARGTTPTVTFPRSPRHTAPAARMLSTPDTDPLTIRVRRVAAALRTREARVAASVAHQGLAARLWSVALGCAALYGAVPDLSPGAVRWDPEGSAPDDLRLAEVPRAARRRGLPRRRRPARSSRTPVRRPARPPPCRARTAARQRRLRPRRGRPRDHPPRPPRRPPPAPPPGPRPPRPPAPRRRGTFTADTDTGSRTGTPPFRRRSCCLYYRVPGGGVCGDCCFVRAAALFPARPDLGDHERDVRADRGFRVRVGLLTREYPPDVYGGAGVHVEFLGPGAEVPRRPGRALLGRGPRRRA
ncbi:hypothetical protein STENM223S_05593 [Streptomyces tendae]